MCTIFQTRSKQALFQKRNNVFLPDYENVELLAMMSEDTKLTELKERIRDVTINERNGLLIITMGVLLFCLSIVFIAVVNNSLVFVGGMFSSALGVFSTLFGFYVVVHYAHQYNNLQKELEHA